MDLLAGFNWLLGVECEFSQALRCLLGWVTKHVLLEELEIVVASDEVNAAWAEDSEHDHWLLHPVKALHETISPTGSRQLCHLLMRSALDILNPVAKLSDSILVVVLSV